MEHTEGKWGISSHAKTMIEVKSKNRIICSTGGYSSSALIDRGLGANEANAQRIVACVNACEGVSTEALSITKGGHSIIKWARDQVDETLNLLEIAITERDKARSVKDTLLESLKTILDPECMEDIRLLIKEAEEGK